MKRTEEIELDGIKYSFAQYPATKAMKLLAKLAKLVGKPVGILTARGGEAEVTPDMLGAAIEALTSQIEPEDFTAMVKDILEGVQINDGKGNRPVVFDIDFAGKIGHLLKLVRKVLEFQYADFFGDLAAITGGAAAAMVKSRVTAA